MPRKKYGKMKSLNITITKEQYNFLDTKDNKSEYIRNIINNLPKFKQKIQKLITENKNQEEIIQTLKDSIKEMNKAMTKQLYSKEKIEEGLKLV